jgi:hypothetical protein
VLKAIKNAAEDVYRLIDDGSGDDVVASGTEKNDATRHRDLKTGNGSSKSWLHPPNEEPDPAKPHGPLRANQTELTQIIFGEQVTDTRVLHGEAESNGVWLRGQGQRIQAFFRTPKEFDDAKQKLQELRAKNGRQRKRRGQQLTEKCKH